MKKAKPSLGLWRAPVLGAALICTVGACSDNGETEAEVEIGTSEQALVGTLVSQFTGRSGERLTAQYLVYNRRLKHFWQFWDNELDTPCNFAQDPDGNLRCFPERTSILYYTDANCSDPVYLSNDPTDPAVPLPTPPVAISAQVNDAQCGAYDIDIGFRAFEVGEKVGTSTTTTLYWDIFGFCEPAFLFSGGGRIFDLVEFGDDDLVNGTLDFRFAGGTRLLEQVVKGDDGSRSPMNQSTGNFRRTYYDRRLQTNVTPVPTSKGTGFKEKVVWAEGSATTFSFLFSDSTCTSPAAIADGCLPRSTTVVEDQQGTLDEDACRIDFDLRKAEPLSPDSLYIGFGTTCRQTSRDDPLLSRGPAANLRPYVKGRATRRFRGGRIQYLVYRNRDNSEVPIGFYDSQLQTTCRPFFLEEDTYACAPNNSPGAGLSYSDPACTVPVISLSAAVTDAPETRDCYTGTLSTYEFDRNTGMVRVYTSGAPLADQSTQLYFKSRDNCFASGAVVTRKFEATMSEVKADVFHVEDF